MRTSKPPSRIERGGNFTIKNFPPPYSLLSSETTLAVRRRGLVPPLPIISHTVASSFFRYKTQSKLRTPNPNLLFPFSVCCLLFYNSPLQKHGIFLVNKKPPTLYRTTPTLSNKKTAPCIQNQSPFASPHSHFPAANMVMDIDASLRTGKRGTPTQARKGSARRYLCVLGAKRRQYVAHIIPREV